jgi:integrase
MARRSYGSGSLFTEVDATGKESWYGRWYIAGQQVQRKIGPKRLRGTREGLTRAQAERELQRRIDRERQIVRSGLSVGEVGETYLEHVEFVLERKQTTLGDYRSIVRKHLKSYFAERPIERIDADWISRYIITNHLAFMHGLFAFALKRGWIVTNPVASVDRPRAPGGDPDIRFLDLSELEALLGVVPGDYLGPTERGLYLIAAMTGLRQGELIALRWVDVDWKAGRIRVRRNYTRQEFGTPKSKRSSRSVPMTKRVHAELKAHFKRSEYSGDDDLVFCHPQTGHPLDASKLRKRYKEALKTAGVRAVRFHDLRHTFGTRCAAEGVPMRMLQEWMGHRDIKTTQIYADYAPSPHEADLLERAFAASEDDEEDDPPRRSQANGSGPEDPQAPAK